MRANLDSAESYDTTTNSWHDMAPMNAKRWAPGAATLAHCVYAIGGYNGSAYLSSAEKYCTAAGSWQMLAPMKRGRAFHGVAGKTMSGALLEHYSFKLKKS